jgi:hypothetical protein
MYGLAKSAEWQNLRMHELGAISTEPRHGLLVSLPDAQPHVLLAELALLLVGDEVERRGEDFVSTRLCTSG